MYSCPTDDIHSVYIDNELPQNYVSDYENHLKVCPKCSAKVEQLKKNQKHNKNGFRYNFC